MLKNLDSPPHGVDSFLWTDFAELRALSHPDKCFSRGDLFGLERRTRDLGHGFKVEERWREIINFSGIRQIDFGHNYPFFVSGDEDTIFLEVDGGAAKRTYLGLLIASCMRNIENGRKGGVARAFEETCLRVFAKLMPDGAEIRSTWAQGGIEAPYHGTLFEKMQKLASDLRCAANFKPRDFKPNDSGDGGIDLIAWHPMADSREGMPIAFAQCGCSRDDWRFKQLEASPNKHGRHFPAMHLWATYYFLPLDLREPDGDWAYKSDIGQAIIVDRLRLVRLVEQYGIHPLLPAMPFVDEALSFNYA